MRINDILIESQQQELEEGPLGDLGRGAAKVAGGIAKGAGMVAGIGKGMSKAYQKGKATSAAHIAGDVPDEEDPEYSKEYARLTQQPAGGAKAAAPAAAPTQGGGGFMGGLKKALGGAQGGDAEAPAQGGSDPAAIQKQIAQKQQEIKDLQAQLKPAAGAAPAEKTAAEPAGQVEPTMEPAAAKPTGAAAKPTGAATKPAGSFNNQLAGGKQNTTAGGKFNPATMKNEPGAAAPTGVPSTKQAAPKGNFDPDTGKPISDKGNAQVAAAAKFDASPKGQAMQAKWDAEDAAAAAPATKTAPAKRTGGKVAGQQSQTPGAIKKREARAAKSGKGKPAASSQAEIDADRDRLMGNMSDSRIRSGKVVAEGYRSIFRKI